MNFKEAMSLRNTLWNRMIKMIHSDKANEIKHYNTAMYELVLAHIDLWEYGYQRDEELIELDEFLKSWGF